MTTRLPKTWELELAKQRELRHEIERLSKMLDAISAFRDRVLRSGGKNWITRVGKANLAYRHIHSDLRATLKALYHRRVVA